MEDIIKNVVAKSLRKKGSNYKLSESSRKSSADFAYASKISSRIHQYAKKNWRLITDRNVFERLLKVVVSLIMKDEAHEQGKLRLGFGNVAALKFFRFNNKKSFFSLVPWQTIVTYDERKNVVKLSALATDVWSGTAYDPRVNRYVVRYHVLRIPVELSEEFDFDYTKELTCLPNTPTIERNIQFDKTKKWDNCLILVIGEVNTWFKTSSDSEPFKTANTLFMAADILEVFRIRNGELVLDTVRSTPPQVDEPEDNGVDWD